MNTLPGLINQQSRQRNPPGVSYAKTLTVPAFRRVATGIFGTTGKLIRVLKTHFTLEGGNYDAQVLIDSWDGKDDDGNVMPAGSYVLTAISHNLQPVCEGGVGNTSADLYGPTTYHGQRRIHAVCVAGGKLFMSQNVNEKFCAFYVSSLSDVQRTGELVQAEMGGGRYICTDGTTVFIAGFDAAESASFDYDQKGYVIPVAASSGSLLTLSGSTGYQTRFGINLPGAFGITTAGINRNSPVFSNTCTGIAVQISGNVLAYCERVSGTLRLYNKSTGAVLGTVTGLDNPRELAFDTNGKLWMCTGVSTCQRYTVSGGSISSDGVSLPGLVAPYAVACNPTNNQIAVVDGGTSQQVKFYANAGGSAVATLGTAGGYVNSPAVTNTKFCFSQSRGLEFTINDNEPDRQNYSSIAFGPGGDFWLNDYYNMRVMHFAADRTYIEQIATVENTGSDIGVQNDPTRYMSGQSEFSIDYTKPLATGWALSKQWGANLTTDYSNLDYGFKSTVVMSNNRTYALLSKKSISGVEVVELTTTGIRYTGITRSNSILWSIDPAGHLYNWESNPLADGQMVITKYALTGFDGSGNPQWGSGQTLTNMPTTVRDPMLNMKNTGAVQFFSNGSILTFDAGRKDWAPDGRNLSDNVPADKAIAGFGYHVGAVMPGETTFRFRSSKGLGRLYTGGYPTDGSMDNGNGVVNGPSQARTIGRLAFWQFRGEFWKEFGPNKWQIVDQTGLPLLTYGPLATDSPYSGHNYLLGFEGMAGNTHSIYLVQSPVDPDVIHAVQNDEARRSWLMRWRVSGYQTVQQQDIPFNKS